MVLHKSCQSHYCSVSYWLKFTEKQCLLNRSLLNVSHKDCGAFLYEERPDFNGFRLVMCWLFELLVMQQSWTCLERILQIVSVIDRIDSYSGSILCGLAKLASLNQRWEVKNIRWYAMTLDLCWWYQCTLVRRLLLCPAFYLLSFVSH